jgi:hypothetical protein
MGRFGVGFPHWEWWGFPHWTFIFWTPVRSRSPRAFGDRLGLFDRLDAPPFVGRLAVRPGMAIGQPVERHLAIAGIARAARPGDLDEAQRDGLSDRRSYGVALNSEFREVIKRAGEQSVLLGLASMVE